MSADAEVVDLTAASSSDDEEEEVVILGHQDRFGTFIDMTGAPPPPPPPPNKSRKRPRGDEVTSGGVLVEGPDHGAARVEALEAVARRAKLKARAWAKYDAKKYGDARALFARLAREWDAVGDAENAALELHNAASATDEDGSHPEAVRLCDASLARAPGEPRTLLTRARARAALGDADGAARDADAALAAARGRGADDAAFRRACETVVVAKRTTATTAAAAGTRAARAWPDVRLARFNGSRHVVALGLRAARAGDRVSAEDARRAYRRAALRLHPDKLRQRGATDPAELAAAAAAFEACGAAVEIFSDDAKRARLHYCYDVLGRRHPAPESADEVLDYDSGDDLHTIRDRTTWNESRRRLDIARPRPPPPPKRPGSGARRRKPAASGFFMSQDGPGFPR